MYKHHSNNLTNQASGGYPADHKTLLEVDGWRLVQSRYPNVTGVESYPYHIKCKSGVFRSTMVGMMGRCAKCADGVPPEIQGLWVLHNWEKVTE